MLAQSPKLPRQRGFTLLEVMVALIVTTIGLLGIAKMQALAYASTGAANTRSLVAVQAAGLAASMHANRTYWGTGAAPVTITITGNSSGTTITESTNTLNTTATAANTCVSPQPYCSAATLAAFDLHQWANALNGLIPNSNATTVITCPVTIPVNCTVRVTWNENTVAINNQSGAILFPSTYVLYVEP